MENEMPNIDDIPTSELLKLENQLCFPLYACSKEVVRRYSPYLDKLGLTYTQYLVMMALWEYGDTSVTQLGRRLYLDSGTLTPLLKKLEQAGYVKRQRSREDERVVVITLTEAGRALQEKAKDIPLKAAGCIDLPPEKAQMLYALLYELLDAQKNKTTKEENENENSL
jgi:DNA-binding MarR family transcriptional regulator